MASSSLPAASEALASSDFWRVALALDRSSSSLLPRDLGQPKGQYGYLKREEGERLTASFFSAETS